MSKLVSIESPCSCHVDLNKPRMIVQSRSVMLFPFQLLVFFILYTYTTKPNPYSHSISSSIVSMI
jgi:hypothetical protein